MGFDFGARQLNRGVQRLIATAQNGLEVVRFGGLRTGDEPSPYEVVERRPMYRLRRYFPDAPADPNRPVALFVPPLMVSADVYDVNTVDGAVAVLHRAGVDPWVVDFGSPATEEGGWERDLADHVVAVSAAVDTVAKESGRDVHLLGYSQGGMFCYQAAAYRHGRGVRSIVTFGSPVDLVAGLPFGLPSGIAAEAAGFLADHVVNRLPITDAMVRTGFQLLDPVKTVKARIDFLFQLHDRAALLPKERQRRFLANEGWVGYSGPAIADLLRQFVAHNRMVSGGFVIRDEPVTLAELTCPILAFVGEVDDIGAPRAVRGILRAAPRAEVFEASVPAGHFGLVAGSRANAITWPTVAQWINWVDGEQPQPELVKPMRPHRDADGDSTVAERVLTAAATALEVGAGVASNLAEVAGNTLRGTIELSGEAARALPRLTRLGMIQPNTRISFGQLLAEQARRAPKGECFLYDGRVHTNEAVNTRIDNVVRGLIHVGIRPAHRVGVLMETRPSALVTIAALSRLGAVAVMFAPGADLAEAVTVTGVDTVVTDPDNLAAALGTGARVLVLGGVGAKTALQSVERREGIRDLGVEVGDHVVDMEQIDPDAVVLPGWYRPNPGRARELAFVLLARSGGKLAVKNITNHRWAVSAFGTASSADLDAHDTVYCLAPLHHPAGILVGLGGAVAGGARMALSRTAAPEQFLAEVRRYGVTVVTYTWTMMRDVLDANPAEQIAAGHPIRLFLGSGMPPGLWQRTLDNFAPARVLEFYASTEGDVVLANVAGAKVGSKGRRVPGTAPVELAAYDPLTRTFLLDDRGFVRRTVGDEVGLLIGKAHDSGSPLAERGLRGVFAPEDAWVPTEHLFRRDSDGDFWLVDHVDGVVKTTRGLVYTQPVADVLNEIPGVDLEVAYGRRIGGRTLVFAAVSVRDGHQVDVGEVTEALRGLEPAQRPDIVYVVDDIPRSASKRPNTNAVRAAELPKLGERTWCYDRPTGSYQVLTEPAAAGLFGLSATDADDEDLHAEIDTE
ncbi:MAG: AMP-binding protein [Mycobacteriaceae bacterium]|nr:AMP-binding protein [Mycobacteriaceae bacterium]